jgi:hypothetical protein
MDKEKALMIQSQGLTKLSKTDLVLAEQDKGQAIKLVAYLLQRLSKLYQLPNWTEDNAVFLAEWIFDNYKYDSLDDIITCLRNPPHTENKQWRLTPDTVKEWMRIILEQRADKREAENKKMKEAFKDKLQDIDYEAFKVKIETEGLPGEKERVKNEQYEKFRMDYLVRQEKKNKRTKKSK